MDLKTLEIDRGVDVEVLSQASSSLALFWSSRGAGREVSLFVLTSQTLQRLENNEDLSSTKYCLTSENKKNKTHLRHYTSLLKTISISESKEAIPTIYNKQGLPSRADL